MKISTQKSDRNSMKQMNQRLVLQLIQGNGPISRRDIARHTGLSAASISGITNKLIASGLVYEMGEAEELGRAGRRAVLLRLNPNAGLVIGVKLGVYSITCVITDLDANVLHSTEYLFGSSNKSTAPYNPDITIQTTIDAIDSLLSETDIDPTHLLGIGIGINGIVDPDTGVSLLAPHFGWHDVPISEPLSKRFGIPIFLENDARALTIAEQWFGAGREANHFAAAVIGYGIGAGIVTNKQIYRGSSGGAGEFGHIILQKDGPLCSCGNRGCLESLASIPAIIRNINNSLASGESSMLSGKERLTIDMIAMAAKAGDALTIRVLEAAGTWLGLGIASLVNMFNPEILVVHGEAITLGTSYFNAMESVMHKYTFNGLGDSLQIIYQNGGNEIWARGAACVVLGSLFTSHNYQRKFSINLPDAPISNAFQGGTTG